MSTCQGTLTSDDPFGGETNGIPNGLQIPTLGLAGILLPTDCPFGDCTIIYGFNGPSTWQRWQDWLNWLRRVAWLGTAFIPVPGTAGTVAITVSGAHIPSGLLARWPPRLARYCRVRAASTAGRPDLLLTAL